MKKNFWNAAGAVLMMTALFGCGTSSPSQSESSLSISSSFEQESQIPDPVLQPDSNETSALDAVSENREEADPAVLQILSAAPEQVVDASFLDEPALRQCFVSLPLDEELLERMEGDFYSKEQTFISPQDLRLVRVLYVDFEGNTRVGELIVNQLIASDIEEIFCTLYENAYPIQRVVLPFGYYADDNAIMRDGITRALAFTWQDDGQTPMEQEHSLGLAVDFNSLYNPQVIQNEDGTLTILPPEAAPYADRSVLQEHMLSEQDLAVQLFEEHGFTWGGIWEGRNDYQHFEKDFNHDTGHLDLQMG